MRSLRMRSRDTRLAVMFATAPASNVIRALAMSTNGVSTGTPTADTLRHTAAHERANEVDVVDHQVEHDRDVGAARIERRQPIALDEPRRCRRTAARAHGAVEALDVARLQARRPSARAIASSASASSSVAAIGFSISTCKPALQRRRGHRVVRRRRHDDAHRVDDVEQRVERRERLHAELRRSPCWRARAFAS